MKKKELIFIIAILLIAFALWGGMFLMQNGNYASIRITIDGEEYGTYSLAEDQVISIGNTNVCEIKDGSVRMTWANCPDQLCIHQRAVDENGGMIVCLPNRIVIEGEKGGEVRYDEEKDSVLDAVT